VFYIVNDNFPNPELADKDGLLCVGGNLHAPTLLKAYSMGIFPWFNQDEPIMWWSPNPRLVLYPHKVKVSQSMKQLLKKQPFDYTINKSFNKVINRCRAQRLKTGTWISSNIIKAYTDLHYLGYAISVEVWQNNKLVGGLYGIQLGNVFFGESMFADVSNASKAALIWFCYHAMQTGVKIIDCQQSTAHLKSMGAEEISRKQFLNEIANAI